MMNRREFLAAGGAGLAAACLAGCDSATDSSAPTHQGHPTSTRKRRPAPPGPSPGIGTWKGLKGASALLADSGARWYYTWAPDHQGIDTPSGCEFVPMIWGEKDLTDDALRRAKASGTTLLGFNEPDVQSQANMSVEAALDAWPRLQQTGLRLGAPGVSLDADVEGQWLDRFMNGVRSRGYRVDFIPVHWYIWPPLWDDYSTKKAVASLRGYLDSTHNRYRLPLWLDEFSLIRWGTSGGKTKDLRAQAEFLTAAATMMVSLPYVERWAWFSLTPAPYSPVTALYNSDGEITEVGKQFQKIS